MLPDDVPAAHSMDSAWFAVDACGHVAAASTGEAGALPGPFRPQEVDRHGLLEAVARVVPPGESHSASFTGLGMLRSMEAYIRSAASADPVMIHCASRMPTSPDSSLSGGGHWW